METTETFETAASLPQVCKISAKNLQEHQHILPLEEQSGHESNAGLHERSESVYRSVGVPDQPLEFGA